MTDKITRLTDVGNLAAHTLFETNLPVNEIGYILTTQLAHVADLIRERDGAAAATEFLETSHQGIDVLLEDDARQSAPTEQEVREFLDFLVAQTQGNA